MLSIGDFARLGLVSVRMLHHYDAIGLLPPARIDGTTGYRFYSADQLPRLNRIVALKGLGFTLQQVAEMLDASVTAEQLRGMLLLRRTELAAQLAADQARLLDVEARLHSIEREGAMPEHEVIVKSVPATVVAELTGVAASYQFADITPVIQPLYEAVGKHLPDSGLTHTGPQVAYYEDVEDGVLVHAAVGVAGTPSPGTRLSVVTLPAALEAATVVHRGELSGIGPAFDAMAHWISANGYTGGGYAREVYLNCPPVDGSAEWVIELQVPVTRD